MPSLFDEIGIHKTSVPEAKEIMKLGLTEKLYRKTTKTTFQPPVVGILYCEIA